MDLSRFCDGLVAQQIVHRAASRLPLDEKRAVPELCVSLWPIPRRRNRVQSKLVGLCLVSVCLTQVRMLIAIFRIQHVLILLANIVLIAHARHVQQALHLSGRLESKLVGDNMAHLMPDNPGKFIVILCGSS